MALIRPRTNALFVRKVEELTRDLGKRTRVIAVTVTESKCPNCIFDAVSGNSAGKYNGTGPEPFQGKVCPVCDNAGKTTVEKQNTVTAPVQFPSDIPPNKVIAGGGLKEGECKLKTFFKNKALLEKAKYFLIDGVRYEKVGNTGDRGLLTKVTSYMKLKRED